MSSFFSVRWLGALALLAALFVAMMFAGLALTPDPVRAENRADQFDARAARERLVRIMGDETPHPVDSAAQDVVRDALLREITALGFTPEVRDMFSCRPQPRGPLVDCARVRNIVFSVGPEGAPAVLAAAHYDSVAAAPGASDDGLGISVWLEVARMLREETLTRRVIFLFSDGEEPGLLGAFEFANNDPLFASVESLVNLEARGSRGPAIFFESNQPNADAVTAYSAAPRPIANSVMADVYALLSNSSDVTALTRPGLDIINVAILDGLEDYHTPQDNIASQDLRSVQHMGDVAFAVTRHWASAADADVAAPMVYTDVASRVFVSMPVWLGQATLAVCVLITGFVWWRTGAGRWSALAAPLVALIGAGALAFGVGFGLSALRPGADWGFAHPEYARAWCILLALLSAVSALMLLRSGRDAVQTGAGAMFWFALIGCGLSLLLSGISILYVIPVVLFVLGALAALVWKPAAQIGLWLSALAMIVIWAPLMFLIELALGFEMPYAFAIIAAFMLLPWLGLIAQVRGEGAWRGLVAVVALGVVASVALSALAPSMTEARPRSLNISYFLNTNDGEARVTAGSADRVLPESLAGVFEPELLVPGDRAETWTTPAAVEQIAPPALQEISVAQEGGERIVRARLAMNGAYRVVIRMPMTAEPLRVRVNGVPTDFADTGGESGEFMNLACQGRACDGAMLEIALGAEAPEDWYLIGQFPGRTTPASDALRARRGPTATPIQAGDGTTTLTRFRPE